MKEAIGILLFNLVLVVISGPENAFLKLFNKRFIIDESRTSFPVRGDEGEPLILSPYIDRNEISEARAIAMVEPDNFLGVDSYAGYITVDKNFNSNLWFWYFPVKNGKPEDAPFVVWLQGGPGASSLFGLFEELGPFSVNDEGSELIENPYSWHKNASIIFIDSPVGTGFSFADKNGYARNQSLIGEHLYIFMDQFLSIFSELRNVPLYITGESYGGKHVPSFAYYIHKNNPTADRKINLQGIAVGNGFTDPFTMLDYSEFLYQLGFIDHDVKDFVIEYENYARGNISEGNMRKAFYSFGYAFGTALEACEISSVYNYLQEEHRPLYGSFVEFIKRPEIRRALHIGDKKFNSIYSVYYELIDDFMNSAKPYLEEILEHYKVMYYSGQMDIICAYPLSVNLYRSLEWSKKDVYLNANRTLWYEGKTVVGYVKRAGNFSEVMVRNAGHMVPTDQPRRALTLIESFIFDKDLPSEEEKGEMWNEMKIKVNV